MAGISGAGRYGRSETPVHWAPATGGIFSRLALAQYAALTAMRWHAFRNGMRSTRGALEAAAGGLNYLVYAGMGLSVGAGLGASAYYLTSHNHLWALPALLWTVFFVWQTTPIAVASFQQQFDLAGLLRFPLGFRPFFVLHLLFGLIDISAVLGALASFGRTIANRPVEMVRTAESANVSGGRLESQAPTPSRRRSGVPSGQRFEGSLQTSCISVDGRCRWFR